LDIVIKLSQVCAVLEGTFTFDVLVFSGKSQWTSLSRWENPTDAQNEARKLVSSKTHQGVKVLQEHFDQAENRFKEKAIFKHFKNENKWAKQEEDDSDFVGFDDFDGFNSGSNWLLPVAGIVTVLAVILGVGIYFFDDKFDFSRKGNSGYFVYELPPVIANVSNGAEVFSVKFNLQLELNNSQDSKAVEFALAQIMELVIDEIQNTNASDLKRSKQIQVLLQALRQKIQDAMGDTDLHGVLFRDIQVFRSRAPTSPKT
jgi:flagellar basal body-associated protein FliL